MNKIKLNIKNNKKTIIDVLILISFISLFFIITHDVVNMAFDVPFVYKSGDSIFFQMIAKGIQDTGWIFSNEYLGAPLSQTTYDFPFFSDAFNFFITKILVMITNNWVTAVNLNYFFIFIATGLTSHYAMTKLSVNRILAIAGSIIYTFLPFRFERFLAHFHLNCYFFLPLIILFMFQFMEDDNFLNFKVSKIQNKKNIGTLIILFLFAITGIYYAFFACFFMVIVFVLKVVQEKKLLPSLKKFIMMIGTIGLSLIVNYIPVFLFQLKNGYNSMAPERPLYDVQTFALKIADLIIPKQSVIPYFQEKISESQVLHIAEHASYLGGIGALGFLILLAFLFVKIKDSKNNVSERIRLLSLLNLSAILLSTMGGFNIIFALLVTPSIRAYNRISVYIAFFSILTVMIIADAVTKTDRFIKISKNKKSIISLVTCAVLLISLVSQARFVDANLYQQKERFISDKNYVDHIEEILPENSMILQLPYMMFPEVPPINDLPDYEHGKMYLHSQHLRWSYGGYKGRSSDVILNNLSILGISREFINQAVILGFSGVSINKLGYTKQELNILQGTIENITGESPYYSKNSVMIFYDLTSYIKEYIADNGLEEILTARQELLSVIPIFSEGFSSLEKSENFTYHWSGSESSINFLNETDEIQEVEISFTVMSTEESILKIIINEEEYTYETSPSTSEVVLNLSLKPGKNIINFECDAEPMMVYGDDRELVFQIIDLEVKNSA